MIRKNVLALLVILSVSLLASPGFAQQEAPKANQAPNSLAAGKHSLSFAVPGGGNPYATGAFGYWMMLTREVNLGINVGFGLDRREAANDETITSWDLLLAPTLKYYTSRRHSVTPYYFAQLNLRIHNSGIDGAEHDPELGLAGGLGVEWFPVTQFSIGGHAGVGVDILRAGNGAPIALGTFTSGLSAQIYF